MSVVMMPRAAAPRVLALCGWVVALAVGVLAAPNEAWADDDLVNRVDFLGWSGINADAFCVRVQDPIRGNRLEVRQIGIPTPVVSVPVTPDSERNVFLSAQFAPWSCVVPGAPGTTAPNGWVVFGQAEGMLLRVGVSNGKGSIEIGKVQARVDTVRNTPAKAVLKTAYWTSDSMRVVVIVNQTIKGDWGMDIDEAYGFKIGK